MIGIEEFRAIEARLAEGPYHADDVAWSQAVGPPADADSFAREAIFVIANSGMRFTVARAIFERVLAALLAGRPASSAFGHVGKAGAMDAIWRDRAILLDRFLSAPDPLADLLSLLWIGPVTVFHLARNFGLDVVKPDVHMARLAAVHGTDPTTLCGALTGPTGYRIGTVDVLLWRACATGILDSRTGSLT